MKFRIERNSLLQQLAWETFVVGGNAATSDERKAILHTLACLLESEVDRNLAGRNSGKSARELLPRLIGSTQSLRTTYLDEAAQLAEELLHGLECGPPRSEALIEAVVGVLLSVRVEDSWTDGFQFHFSQGVMLPESERGKAIVAYCERLWRIASEADVPTGSRRIALALLSKHHQTLNFADRQAGAAKEAPDWTFLLRSHLEHARALAKSGVLSLSEWFVVRSLWDWHAEYDDDVNLRAIAQECEALFRAEPLRGGFAGLLLDDDASGAALDAVAMSLRTQTAEAISKFFREGCAFLVADEHVWRRSKLEAVAWQIGAHAGFGDNVRQYVEQAIAPGSSALDVAFAVEILGGHLHELRMASDDITLERELRSVLARAPDGETRRTIITRLYQATRLGAIRAIRPIECTVIVEHLAMFDRDPRLRLLGCIFAIDSMTARAHADSIFLETFATAPFELADAIRWFCVGFHPFLIGRSEPLVPLSDYEWLLDIFARIPNPPAFRAIGDLDELVKPYPKFSSPWFVDVVLRRRERLLPLLGRERDVFEIDEAVWIITPDLPLLDVVSPLTSGAVGGHDRSAIESLLALTHEQQSVSHYLAAVVARLDPSGVLVPDLVCSRLQSLRNPSWQDIAVWADYASAYPFNSDAWRRISIVACSLVTGFSATDAEAVFSHLAQHQTGPWSGGAGVVHERWSDAVETAKKLLAAETEQPLLGFRGWRVTCAERDLAYQHGRNVEELRATLGTIGDE